MAWLGTALARAGYIAVAVDHPGNNSNSKATVEGLALWWERAADLSDVLDGMLADQSFGPHIDAAHVAAAGYSLGGYTGMAFVYTSPSFDAYYMRDTLIPLSIAFFTGSGTLVSSTTMPVCPDTVASCPIYEAAGVFRLALEVPAGKLAALGIGVGSTAHLGGPGTACGGLAGVGRSMSQPSASMEAMRNSSSTSTTMIASSSFALLVSGTEDPWSSALQTLLRTVRGPEPLAGTKGKW